MPVWLPRLAAKLGVRSRLALITLVAAAPVPALLVAQGVADHRAALADARRHVSEVARLTAERQADLMAAATRTLRTLATGTGIPSETGECPTALQSIAADDPRFTVVGVMLTDPSVTCDSGSGRSLVPPADIGRLRDALRAGGAETVVIPGLAANAGMGAPVLVARALPAPPGGFRGLAYVGFDLPLPTDDDARLLASIIDPANGTVLASISDPGRRPGDRLPPSLIPPTPRAQVLVADGLVTGFAPVAVAGRQAQAIMVAIEAAKVAAVADRLLMLRLAEAMAAVTGATLLAGILAHFTQVRPLRAMIVSASRAGRGEMTDWPEPPSWHAPEIHALSEALAGMMRNLAAAQSAQARSERLHRMLSENASDMICWISRDGAISHVSAASFDILGFTPEELSHQLLMDIALPDDRAARTETLRRLWAGELESASLERQVRHKDGHGVWLEVKYRLVRDDATGAPTDVVSAARDITSRVLTEKALRESERNMRLLADNATDMIVWVDLNFRRLYLSPACVELTGFTPEEMLQDADFHSGMHPDDLPELDAQMKRLRDGERTVVMAYRRRHRDGHYVWLGATARRLTDDEGFVLVVRDLTETKQAEARLLEQRTFFHALFEHTADALLVMRADPGGGFALEEVNTAATFIAGMPAEVCLGRAPIDLLPAPWGEALENRLRACRDDRLPTRGELDPSDTSGRNLEVIHVPLLGPDGTVERILVSARDITHLRAAEVEAAQANRRLVMAEQMAGLGHWRVSLPGREIYCSSVTYEIFGLDPDGPPLTAEAMLASYHPDDQEEVRRLFDELLDHGQHYEHVARLILADGRTRHVQARGMPEYAADNSIVAAFGILMDTTERVAAEAALQQARDAAETARGLLEELALEDALTGLANRRQFDGTLADHLRQAARDGTPLALAMIDVDRFKQFNDKYGHVAGDECLRAVAVAVRSCLKRPLDLAARYGGEEFAILLPNTDAQGAMIEAEDIRRSVRSLRIPHAGSEFGVVTISVGVAATVAARAGAAPNDATALIRMADEALYEAKTQSRDTVRSYRAAATAATRAD